MRNRILLIFAALTLLSATVPAVAGTIGIPPETHTYGTEKTEDEAFASVEWTFGKSVLPEIAVGFRSVKVQSDGDVFGGQASLSFDLAEMGMGKFKLQAVQGDENAQLQLGTGYSIARSSFLITGGVQGNHVFGGADYLFGTGWQAVGGFNTIGNYDLPDPDTESSCQSGYSYNGITGLCVPNVL
ncbi:hypothetical protein KBTX_00260 [wastewater metagenome]|uniref:Uncharacterized protein n=4 Tax=root TaxID=1 RepID=A0A5B8R597_9ZZZZ|nr:MULTISPECIES: hypothetical protein [Arhodomonas]MCS4504161.1 hypothetical protein [Arhodomonas aquaeolei]QEA03959.1 hypothetical protein KBTEX_00260 [uncultured organism]